MPYTKKTATERVVKNERYAVTRIGQISNQIWKDTALLSNLFY